MINKKGYAEKKHVRDFGLEVGGFAKTVRG
jgi:hypothetical protein